MAEGMSKYETISRAFNLARGGKKMYGSNPSKYQQPRKVEMSPNELISRGFNLARGMFKK
jgi:hypothetical protein